MIRELDERRQAPIEREPGAQERRELLRHDQQMALAEAGREARAQPSRPSSSGGPCVEIGSPLA
jgi:hypothetical protein